VKNAWLLTDTTNLAGVTTGVIKIARNKSAGTAVFIKNILIAIV